MSAGANDPRSMLRSDVVVMAPSGRRELEVAFDAFRPASSAVRMSWVLALLPWPGSGLVRRALTVAPLVEGAAAVEAVRSVLKVCELRADALVVRRASDRPEARHVGIALAGGRPTNVVKVAMSPAAQISLRTEADLLESLSEDEELRGRVPRVAARDRGDDRWLVTEWLGGEGLRAQHLPEDVATLVQHLGSTVDGSTATWLLTAADEADAVGEASLADVLRQGAAELTMPLRFAHGDLVPWNVRLVDGRYVLVDWETGGLRPPLWDLIHWHVATAALLGRGGAPRRVSRFLRSQSWQLVGRAGAQCGLTRAQVRAAVQCYAAGSLLELRQRYGAIDLGARASVRRELLRQTT